jgi:hypothetical protein
LISDPSDPEIDGSSYQVSVIANVSVESCDINKHAPYDVVTSVNAEPESSITNMFVGVCTFESISFSFKEFAKSTRPKPAFIEGADSNGVLSKVSKPSSCLAPLISTAFNNIPVTFVNAFSDIFSPEG